MSRLMELVESYGAERALMMAASVCEEMASAADHAEMMARHMAEIRAAVAELERDAARYRWLRDMQCNSLSVSFNDGPASNYMTVREWMDECMPESYSYVPPDVAERMKQSNALWSIQIYPDTPIGFNDYHGDTLDAAIDAAMEAANVPE